MNLNHTQNRIYKKFAFLLCLFFALAVNQKTHAQRKADHITLNDSAYMEGYVKLSDSDPTKNVLFKRKKKDSYKNYSIGDVSDFHEDHRDYQRKTFEFKDQKVTVFLEKLVYDNPDMSIYKWINKKGLFFIESDNGLSLLGENFLEEISKRLDNPNLNPLLEISKLNYTSLSYLLTMSKTKPRTFSRFFRVTPQSGVSFYNYHLTVPNQNSFIKLKGTSTNLGVNLEFLPTYYRNLSLNISPSFGAGNADGFNTYTEGSSRFDTDLYFNFTNIQLPVTARYYLDLRPNEFRTFIELGYSWSSLKAQNGIIDIAEFKENTIRTDTRDFDPSSNYHGFIGGVGVEKYFKKTRALTFGIKYSSLRNTNSEVFSQLSPYIGFKF